jgi:NADPH:quinone reductase-like Zn-dependent oxidoreductase
VQITRSGGPGVLDVVDLPDPVPGDGEQLYEVSAAGTNVDGDIPAEGGCWTPSGQAGSPVP